MFFVAGCTSADYASEEPLTPLPQLSYFNDPDNEQFMDAVNEYIKAEKAPENTRYEFTRIDLDNDGRREGIVMMKTPHQYWCNFDGCKMVVFKAHNDQFELISEISPVRGPLVVSNHKTNGWNDLIVSVSGRMNASIKEVALKYDGSSYPLQPAFQPAVKYAYNSSGGVRIFP
jgi:hypothetical protein